MRVNGYRVTENPVSKSNIHHNPYYTVPGKMGGMCVSHEHVQWFKDMMAHFNSYLEIGTFDGIALSLYAEAWPNKRFTAVDSFETAYATGNGHYEYFFENCKRLDNVDLYIGRSHNVLPHIKEKFDVIFIDGAHDYHTIHGDYQLSWPLLNKGGWLIFHDIDLIDTLQAILDVERNEKVKRQHTPIGVIYVEKK
jgi:predicted O-methyltransferase YrrM